ncbi:alpha/beta fold hydrolase [Streptomyces sp. NPDC102270]|uniref:alpha/beta fold hydrolase n=1 Tax=Streptomyces sp. NPDC102270 TaxID=3366150 RepID=UPI003817A637
MAYISDTADTLHVEGRLARYAYRDFGKDAPVPPLVLLQRFRGTLDHWDPAFLEVLAQDRRVIIFDNAGVSESTGEVPTTMEGMAESAFDFLAALGLDEVDLLGWSVGGFVAQLVALDHPELVRKLIVAGSGPGGVPGTPELEQRVVEYMTSPVPSQEAFLYLFFGLTDEGVRLGKESLARLETRLQHSKADVPPERWTHQLQAIQRWSSGTGSAWSRLEELKLPVLVANGSHDVMVDSGNSFAMAQKLPTARTVFYSGAGHAFLFQYPDEFGGVVLDFLNRQEK